MPEVSLNEPTKMKPDQAIFTILGGTTIPERAAIVRSECREKSKVELRRNDGVGSRDARVEVWLECKSVLGILTTWKKIGHVPEEVANDLSANPDGNSSVVAYGVVKTIYAPAGRDEAVVTVEISPKAVTKVIS